MKSEKFAFMDVGKKKALYVHLVDVFISRSGIWEITQLARTGPGADHGTRGRVLTQEHLQYSPCPYISLCQGLLELGKPVEVLDIMA
jgi:hypothetical protein